MSHESKTHDRETGFAVESLEKWMPRFVANGIDPNDLERLRERINSWTDWCDEFAAVGEMHANLGAAARNRGSDVSAADHFTRAAMYFHFGSHVWHVDEERRERAHQRAVELFHYGGTFLDPPVQRIEAPYDSGGFDVPGNLRVPDRSPDRDIGDSPLVILLPGLDSIKEELHAYEADFHRRGLATLAVDGAGQGETWYNQGMTADYPKLISAVIDHVCDRSIDGLDAARIAVYGVSLGGFYAPFVAANDERVDACVGISGPFTVGPVSSRESALIREQFAWACKTDSPVEIDERTEAMTLRDEVEDLTVPTLAITGANDRIIAPEQTERIATRAPNGTFICYENGNHVCNNIPYKYRPRAADWVREQLR